jgi:hypothetical protein
VASKAPTSARGRRSDLSTSSYVFVPSRAAAVVCYSVIATGIGLRLLQLLSDRGLSQDEAQLALNIMHRSVPGLFGQLDSQQAAPVGFLAVQKLVVWGLGSSEYALRLFPLVAGSLALVLTFLLAREVISPAAVPLATAFFAVSDPLINWTVYGKQYAVDVLVTVVVLWIGFRLSDRPDRLYVLVLYAGVGTVAVWLSHPSVFVLAGVSTALVAGSLMRKEWRRALVVSLASISWLASLGVFALTLSRNLERLQTALSGTAGAFADSGGHGVHSLRQGFGEFRYASGIPHFLQSGSLDAGQVIFLLAAAFCVVGVISLGRAHAEKAVILVAPLGFMLIAWGLNKYPLLGRTQIFLVPNFVLLLAEGVIYAATRPQRASTRAASVVSAGVIGLALVAPTIGHAVHSRSFGDLKPVLDYLARNERQGDTLYVYYTAQDQFRYYLECGCAGADFEAARNSRFWPIRPGPGGPELFAPQLLSVPPRLIVAAYRGDDPSRYASDLDTLRGARRVWFLVSHLGDSQRRSLLTQLDQRGTQRAAFTTGKGQDLAAVYLYDLTRPPRQPN